MAQDYAIQGQVQRMNLNPSGSGFENVWEVTYKVTSGPARGAVATVTIPAADHNAEYVDGAIREQISNLHDVAGLGYSQ
jgi:hypothetical protein